MKTPSENSSSASKRGVLVLAGATASGKTQLAIELARRFNAEIVGADSRQIYRGMPIGTAAPTAAQRTAVPHHLIDFLDPQQRYSAAQFSYDAIECISDIHARGKHAIVTGGTGFYIRALSGDVALAPPGDAGLRQRLSVEARLHEPDFLHQWLAVREPARAASIAPADRYRVMRSLEVSLMQNPSGTALSPASLIDIGISFAKVFIDVDDATLEKRIAARVDAMLADGLTEEAERIGPQAVAASAVGYLQALAYVRGWQTFDELRRAIIRATRRYAKRQRTWFRSEPQTIWVRSNNPLSDVEKLAREKLGWA